MDAWMKQYVVEVYRSSCQLCFAFDPKFKEVHHIAGRQRVKGKRVDDVLTNLILLCKDCHDVAGHYGMGTNRRLPLDEDGKPPYTPAMVQCVQYLKGRCGGASYFGRFSHSGDRQTDRVQMFNPMYELPRFDLIKKRMHQIGVERMTIQMILQDVANKTWKALSVKNKRKYRKHLRDYVNDEAVCHAERLHQGKRRGKVDKQAY